MTTKVFADTDVVISSLISSKGAAHLLINHIDSLDIFVSNISSLEIEKVARRLALDETKAKELIKKQFSVVGLEGSPKELQMQFSQYVLDPNDAHIVAGAKFAKVRFLISYNIKHFKSELLKEDFNIILATPANLIQYLRGAS